MKRKAVKVVAAILGGVLIVGAAIFIKISTDDVTLKTRSITVEAGDNLNVSVEDLVKADKDVMKELKLDRTQVNTKEVGKYKLFITYGEKKYTVKVIVEDTKAPQGTFKSRVFFTNNVKDSKPKNMFQSVTEYSAYEGTFTFFEEASDLAVMNDENVEELEESIVVPCDQKALAKKTSEDVPTEEGIYNAVLKLEDVHGNVQYEEVYVVLDKTAPVIEDAGDKTIETANIDKKPVVTGKDYKATDNVDGTVTGGDIKCDLELTNKEKHVYTNHVSYTDRAGNTATADFKITLKYNKNAEDAKSNSNTSNKGSNTASSNKGNSSNGSTTQSSTTKPSGSQSTGSGYVDAEPLLPGEQEAVDAGYYKVIVDSDGDYWVLVPNASDAEYEKGRQLIIDYLAKMGYEPAGFSGHNLGGPNWNGKDYIVVCTEIQEKSPSIEDDDFWRE